MSEEEVTGIGEALLTQAAISFISHSCKDLSDNLYKNMVKTNRKILTWTIYTEKEAKEVKELCDNITFEGFLPLKEEI